MNWKSCQVCLPKENEDSSDQGKYKKNLKTITMTKFLKAVLLTALFVGTTDIVSAFITVYIKSGKFPDKMFNYIAAGLLGIPAAINGGTAIQLLGLFIHYFIAFSFTLFFFLVFRKIKFLAFNKYLIGMLYAVFVNLTMDLILKLTPLPRGQFKFAESFIGWITLGVIFGIPIAYNTYKYYGVHQTSV